MKRILMASVLLFLHPASPAQVKLNTRLNTYGGYVFKDRLNAYTDNQNYFNGTINAGLQWGLGLEVMGAPGRSYEFSFVRQDTRAPLNYWNNGAQFKNVDISINYLMAGRNTYFGSADKTVETYIGTDVGGILLQVKNPDPGAETSLLKFAWGFRGGVNLWTHERVGVKLNARILSAVQAVGGGVYFGTWGLGGSVSPYASIYQISLSGGLVFKLSK